MIYLNSLAESLASLMYESPPRIYLAFGAMAIALVLARNATRIFTSADAPEGDAIPAADAATKFRRHQPAPARRRAASHHPRAISCRRTSCCRGS